MSIRWVGVVYVGVVDVVHSRTSDKGHNRNNLRTKDKVQCTKLRLSYSSNTLLTSNIGQPLNKGQNGQNTMGPKRVRYSEVPLYVGVV